MRTPTPADWLTHAYSDLVLAHAKLDDVLLADLCFHAQQVCEKALKGVLADRGVTLPDIHDIGQLVAELASSGCAVPEDVRQSSALTRYVEPEGYPCADTLSASEYEAALEVAITVFRWASAQVAE